jgi:hypothetical protein
LDLSECIVQSLLLDHCGLSFTVSAAINANELTTQDNSNSASVPLYPVPRVPRNTYYRILSLDDSTDKNEDGPQKKSKSNDNLELDAQRKEEEDQKVFKEMRSTYLIR